MGNALMNHNGSKDLEIRFARKEDQAAILDLINDIFIEYDDEVCPQGAEQDLLDIDLHYRQKGGEFWVLDDGRQILGTHGFCPAPELGDRVCVFRRLYLHPTLRGTSWGHQLMQLTIDWAVSKEFQRVEFWSDTRFHRAHRFFTKFGFEPSDLPIRTKHDGVKPYQELHFWLDLAK